MATDLEKQTARENAYVILVQQNAALIRRVERLTAVVKQVAESDPDSNDAAWANMESAREALKEEP
jgi:hypothetical protein